MKGFKGKIYKGRKAEQIAKRILEHGEKEILNFEDERPPFGFGNYPKPYVMGIYQEGEFWTVFDNTKGEMFMECTKDKKKAWQWINGEILTDIK